MILKKNDRACLYIHMYMNLEYSNEQTLLLHTYYTHFALLFEVSSSNEVKKLVSIYVCKSYT